MIKNLENRLKYEPTFDSISIGDRLRVKSIDWYNNHPDKNSNGDIYPRNTEYDGQLPFVACMSSYCGHDFIVREKSTEFGPSVLFEGLANVVFYPEWLEYI